MAASGLEFEARSEGGLRVRASSAYEWIQLGLGSEFAEVRARGANPVSLPWRGASEANVEWWISSWAWVKQWQPGESNAAGVAVLITGSARAKCVEVIHAINSLGRRLTERDQAYASLPIVRSDSPAHTFEAERDTLRALVSMLESRTNLRARLDDRERMQRLVRELSVGCVALPRPTKALSRDRIDIRTAIVQSGLVYEHGRPVPGDPTVGLEEASGRVLDALHLNRHRQGRPVDEATVTAMVRHSYCDVEPWPFRALMS